MRSTMREDGNLPPGPDVELSLDEFTNNTSGTNLCAKISQHQAFHWFADL